MTFGDPADPDRLLIYLNMSEGGLSPFMREWTAKSVWHYLELDQFGPCSLVTERPDCYPAGYVEVRYGPPLSFYTSRVVGSLCTTRVLLPWLDTWDSNVIWIDAAHCPPEAPNITAAFVHEFGHCLGWSIYHNPAQESHEWWALVRKNHPIAVANMRKYRGANKGE